MGTISFKPRANICNTFAGKLAGRINISHSEMCRPSRQRSAMFTTEYYRDVSVSEQSYGFTHLNIIHLANRLAHKRRWCWWMCVCIIYVWMMPICRLRCEIIHTKQLGFALRFCCDCRSGTVSDLVWAIELCIISHAFRHSPEVSYANASTPWANMLWLMG